MTDYGISGLHFVMPKPQFFPRPLPPHPLSGNTLHEGHQELHKGFDERCRQAQESVAFTKQSSASFPASWLGQLGALMP